MALGAQQYISITSLISTASENNDTANIKARFEVAEKLILQSNSNADASEHSFLFEGSPDVATDYLFAVDDILRLKEVAFQQEGFDIADRAEKALELAMLRLADEFRHVLSICTVPLDTNWIYSSTRRISLSIASSAGESMDDSGTFGEDSKASSYCFHERGGSFVGVDDDEYADLIHPEAVFQLKEIADRMIRSGYESTCMHIYSSFRRYVLDECLSIIGFKEMSIEEIEKMEWSSLIDKIKKWRETVQIIVRVLLKGEKRLCNYVFAGSDMKQACLNEISKVYIMQLLNFGEAIAIGKRSSEKTFKILDMYDTMVDVYKDFEVLFPDDSGEVSSEAWGLLARLGEAVKSTLVEFDYAVQVWISSNCKKDGAIHPMARDVMNYIILLMDYSDSINKLLEICEIKSDQLPIDDSDNALSPSGRYMLLLIASLESGLERESNLYNDDALQYIFLMNNTFYIVNKVKNSELGKTLGDTWVRKRLGRVRQHALSYLRVTWAKVLSCLMIDTYKHDLVKGRFKKFNASIKDIYEIQKAWRVPDIQLCEELRLTLAERVIHAYRSFFLRYGKRNEKYIKYTPEDLENLLLGLFKGSPGI